MLKKIMQLLGDILGWAMLFVCGVWILVVGMTLSFMIAEWLGLIIIRRF